jgi:hypothetical protein
VQISHGGSEGFKSLTPPSRAPAKSGFVPVCPLTTSWPGATRPRWPSRMPDPATGMFGHFGADRDFAGALGWDGRHGAAGSVPVSGGVRAGDVAQSRGSSPAASSPVTRFSTGSRVGATRPPRQLGRPPRDLRPSRARPCARQRRRPLVLRHRTTAAIPGRVSSPLTPGPALRAAGPSHGRFGRPRAPSGRRSAMGYAHP